jgi:hypothetical protein
MATFQLLFSFQGTGGSPMGADPENRVGDQDTGSPSRPVSSGLQVPGEPGIVVQEQDPLGDLPAACVFSSECPSIAPAEISNTPR